MKNELITYFNRKLHQMDLADPRDRPKFLSQAFGALEFACGQVNDWDKETELIDLWNNEWKAKLESKAYGLDDNC